MASKNVQREVTLESPVTALAGVGPAKAAAYGKLGVHTVEDLLYHIPRSYENRGDIRTLDCARTDGRSAVVLTVATVPSAARLRGRMTILKFRAVDDSGVCEISFFNQPYLKQTFVTGTTWRFFGTVERKSMRSGTRYLMTSPAFEPWDEDKPLPDFTPVYPLAEGLSQKQVASNMADALALCGARMTDALPDEIRREHGLCTLAFALRTIHDPTDYTGLAAAKKRLVFDELFYFSMLMARRGQRRRETGAFPCRKQNITPLLKLLPYELTGAQKRCISEIAADMKTDVSMSRIVIGDVGSGKTVVAAAAMYIAVLNGRQAALMAPTEILARQHYEELSALFSQLGVRTELLVGAMKAADKRRVKAAAESEDPETRADIIVGTHALITEDVNFSSLSLAVTDEQHRFGVEQRAALARKAEHAHVLAMSATPIPRSLALVMYGDLDISKIDEMPAGRQKTDTFVVDESYRERINGFIRRTAQDGGQVYIVCPSIDEAVTPDGSPSDGGEVDIGEITDSGIDSRPPLKAASVYAQILRDALPELTVALIHGKMKAAEKEAVMTGFAAGDIDVLVSTTVIEVGVNVPNATLMIVENAERFGLSQLHQLRGRVGRGKRKSYCILVSDVKGENARKRLEVMHSTNDGFAIAEADLETRGPGDFIRQKGSDSVRQSGGLRFRFADLCGDASLLAAATASAKALLEADPLLEAHPELGEVLAQLSGGDEDR